MNAPTFYVKNHRLFNDDLKKEVLFDDGTVSRTLVFTSSGPAENLQNIYRVFVFTGNSPASWIFPEIVGNRIYDVINTGTENLTINYPGGLNKFFDLETGTEINAIVIESNSKITLIDNGIFLIQ